MKKKIKTKLLVALCGCMIGTVLGLIIVSQPKTVEITPIPVSPKSPISMDGDDTSPSNPNMILTDEEQESLKKIQEQMIKDKKFEAEGVIIPESEEDIAAAEAKKKTEEAAKEAEKAKSEDKADDNTDAPASEEPAADAPTTETPATEEPKGDVIEGLDNDYYNDYTEKDNVEEDPESIQPKIDMESLGDDMIIGPIDFGDPAEHQSSFKYESDIDMSDWDL